MSNTRRQYTQEFRTESVRLMVMDGLGLLRCRGSVRSLRTEPRQLLLFEEQQPFSAQC